MDFFDRVAELRRQGRPFAVATVVGRRAPVSSHLGDRAIVLADGRMDGFVGGSCSRDIVRRQAIEVIRLQQPRLVSIRPDAGETGSPDDPEHVIVRMGCVSEGAVDVYVEPYVPPRRVLVAGATPVAAALASLGRSLQYEVVRVADHVDWADVEPAARAGGDAIVAVGELGAALRQRPVDAAIVATQGHYDEDVIEAVLKAGVSYVGLVASRKRGAAVTKDVADRGVADVGRVSVPAGLDLGARTPPEIALSIFAEIVQRAPRRVQPFMATGGAAVEEPTATAAAEAAPADASRASVAGETARDPVCGMEVNVATARHSATVEGVDYYFCCPHCRANFLREPATWLEARP